MVWPLLLVAAFIVGKDAAERLSTSDPLPVAWFEAGITVLLILGALALLLFKGADPDEPSKSSSN